ncbi:MAG: hypothetical protein AAF726_16050 [Planctomycetota bacterium]
MNLPSRSPLASLETGCALSILTLLSTGCASTARPGVPSPARAGALTGAPSTLVQEVGDAEDLEEPDIYDGSPFQEPIEGYPRGDRIIGTPVDPEADFARGFPKKNSVLTGEIPKSYFQWKEKLYADYGIKLAFNLTLIGQLASDVLPQDWLTGGDTNRAASGIGLVLEGKWEAINRGEDYQGSLTAAVDWRQAFGGTSVPAFFLQDTGSIWTTDLTVIEWDPWLSTFYWEQWFTKNRFVARVGTQAAVQIFDFFRFKDGRSSFSNSEFWFPIASTPLPGPGLGASFELWPKKDSPLYVVGTVNDLNFEVGKSFAWDEAFRRGEFFYGLEVGYNWGTFPTNFDHLHAQIFYADEASTLPAGLPSKSGAGFKIRGSKQWDRVVGFASYTNNNAQGGPFGITLLENAATAGVAYLRPLDIRGEISIGANWGQPFSSFAGAAPVFQGLKDQYGIETYWKLLLTPDVWITPGIQLVFDPALNPDVSTLAIGTVKLHFFL